MRLLRRTKDAPRNDGRMQIYVATVAYDLKNIDFLAEYQGKVVCDTALRFFRLTESERLSNLLIRCR